MTRPNERESTHLQRSVPLKPARLDAVALRFELGFWPWVKKSELENIKNTLFSVRNRKWVLTISYSAIQIVISLPLHAIAPVPWAVKF